MIVIDCIILKYLCIAAIIIAVAVCLIVVIVRRIKSKRKVRCMCMQEKIDLLNELSEPFGFSYVPQEDVFTSCVDAWQREQGYEGLFDKMAPGLNMVLDAWLIYFVYEGKTWMIELWKGQYGINTGGEVGVYCAKGIVPKIFYPVAHFDAVSNEEMPLIRCTLERKCEEVYTLERRHWWLTGFRMGTFSRPRNLRMLVTMTFCDSEFAQAFYQGIQNTGVPMNKYRICCNEVYLRMDFSPKICCIRRIHRGLVQLVNCFNCWLYRAVTHPFLCTVDRMLFLYFQLPFCFRLMLRLKRYRRPRFCRKKKRYDAVG